MHPRGVRRLLAALLVCWAPAAAHGHALVLEASPVHDAILAAAPDEVRLRFNSRIEHGLTRLSLEEDGGRPVPLPAGTPAAPGPDRLIVRLPPLPPGRYVLRFTVLAADGHLTSSALRFTVRAAATR